MTSPEPQPCRPIWEPQWPQKVYWLAAGFALIMTAFNPVDVCVSGRVVVLGDGLHGRVGCQLFRPDRGAGDDVGAAVVDGGTPFPFAAPAPRCARRRRRDGERRQTPSAHCSGSHRVVPAAIALSGSVVCCATLAWAWWMGWPSGSIPEGDGRKEAAWACALAVTGGKQSRRSTQRAEHRSTRRCIARIATKYVALVRNNPLTP